MGDLFHLISDYLITRSSSLNTFFFMMFRNIIIALLANYILSPFQILKDDTSFSYFRL